MQEVLDGSAQQPVRVLVVWQSILATDWASPGAATLSRVHDARARQFWDKDNLVPRQIGERIRGDSNHPEPDCCWENDVPWDMVMLYPPGAKWDDAPPAAVFIDGPVYRVKAQLEMALK